MYRVESRRERVAGCAVVVDRVDEGNSYFVVQIGSLEMPVCDWESLKSTVDTMLKELGYINAIKCGAYAEFAEALGKPEGWQGCTLPAGHTGEHRDEGEVVGMPYSEVDGQDDLMSKLSTVKTREGI